MFGAGKCLGLGGCCLKLVLSYKGSAVLRCVQTFSSGIEVITKMLTRKKVQSSVFPFRKSYQTNSCLFKVVSSFFLNTGLVNMILEEIPEP